MNMKVVKTYTPQNPVFIKPEKVKSLGIEAELFPELETEDEKLQALKECLDFAIVPSHTSMNVTRFLDNIEIGFLREEYTEEMETVLPVREAEYEDRKAEFKATLHELAALVAASETKVRDLISQINQGTTRVALDSEKTFRIAHEENYLYYSVINGKLILVSTEKIPEKKEETLFDKVEKEKSAKFFNAESNQEQYFGEAS